MLKGLFDKPFPLVNDQLYFIMILAQNLSRSANHQNHSSTISLGAQKVINAFRCGSTGAFNWTPLVKVN